MTINKNQRKILIVGVVLFILIGVFPPWIYTLDARSVSSQKPAGYFLIIEPPEPERSGVAYGVEVDINRLIIQWLVAAAATGLGFFLAQNEKRN